MLLKYNISNINNEKRLLSVKSYTIENVNDSFVITIETNTPHLLKNDDPILLKRDIIKVENYTKLLNLETTTNYVVYVEKSDIIKEKDKLGRVIEVEYPSGYYVKSNSQIKLIKDNEIDIFLSKYNSFNDKLYVQIDKNNNCKFYITLKKYHNIITTITQDLESHSIFKFKGNIPVLLCPNDNITVYKQVYAYTFMGMGLLVDNYITVTENPEGKTNYLGSDYLLFGASIYKWQPSRQKINCTYINENTFKYENDYIFENDSLEIIDERFYYETIDINGNSVMNLYNDVKLYEQNEYINLSLPINDSSDIGLNDEFTLVLYFDERKKNLISGSNDYEKRCFIPCSKSQGNIIVLDELNKLNFNVFLRDRSDDEEWNTSDVKGWNQYKINENGDFEISQNLTNGDLVNVLGFTDDDIYYRKKKVDKTFLRLSFFDSNDPFKQMLLFYSTIFLDSGDLYLKYINNIQNNEKGVPIVEQTGFGDNNLTLTFNAMDRFNHEKSSEGFYLYLFPDGIKNGEERTIYLKVELNNAANGKTVPLMCPGKHFTDSDFPKSLIGEDGNISKLYEYMFIPINIRFDILKKEYVYYFKNINVDKDNGNYTKEITINLYEPKINPLE